MSTRRRLLLALLSAVKWVVNRFTYIYNSIVPSGDYKKARLGKIEGNGEIVNQQFDYSAVTTSTNNGITFTNNNDGTFTLSGIASGGNAYKEIKSIAPNNHYYLIRGCPINGSTSTYHIRVSKGGGSDAYETGNGLIIKNDGTEFRIFLRVAVGTDLSGSNSKTFIPQIIDLTKEFGTGNEPTSLTDNRIKRIIAKGYIPTNSGTYDSSVVKEIEYSRLPDEYQEVEYLESHGTEYINSGFNASEKTKLIGDIQFTQQASDVQSQFGCGLVSNTTLNRLLFGLDREGYSNIVVGVGTQISISSTVPNMLSRHIYSLNAENRTLSIDDNQYTNVGSGWSSGATGLSVWLFARNRGDSTVQQLCYAKLFSFKIYDNDVLVRNFVPCYRKSDNIAGLYDLVNNVFYTNQGTGTFAVGNDISSNKLQLPQPIKLNGVINAHDTFEVLSDSYRFTRNMWNVDMSQLAWEWYGNFNNQYLYFTDTLIGQVYIEVGNNDINNTLCPAYTSYSNVPENVQNLPNMALRVRSGDGRIYLNNKTFNNDVVGLTNSLQGIPLYYQLATPQVISIPKKHLGCVRLKDLEWEARSGNKFVALFSNNVYGEVGVVPKMFSFKFITVERKDTLTNTLSSNLTMSSYLNDSGVVLRNDSYSTVSDFLASLTDIDILFYETQNEVQDFTNSLDIQSGGFLNAKQLLDEVCEVLPNVELKMRK